MQKPELLYFLFIFEFLISSIFGFCNSGCKCHDEIKSVTCENVTEIPILFHPMLRSLVFRNYNKPLKLDAVSIGLYQELEFLDLSENQIQLIPSGLFGSLKKLKELRLRGNRLSNLDFISESSVVGSLPVLEKLDLSHNEIERLTPNQFLGATSLTHLNLSSNRLHLLDSTNFFGLNEHLQNLDLSKNRLAKLSLNQFKETPALTSLNLSGNILSELPAEVFSTQRRLLYLDLSANLLSNIDKAAFANLYSLKSLNLAKNLLTISDLKSVYPENGLSSNWKYLPKLEFLILSANPISLFSEHFFRGLYSLRILHIENMPQLQKIESSAFDGLVKLEQLYLAANPLLKEIHPNAFGSQNSMAQLNNGGDINDNFPLRNLLRRLDLADNQLSQVDINLVDWRQLEWLDLSGNRWDCNCQLLEFLPKLLRKLNDSGYGGALCNMPETLFNVNLKDIETPTASCLSETIAIAPTSNSLTIISLGVFLVALTLVILFLVILCCGYCCCRKSTGNSIIQSPPKKAARRNRFVLIGDCLWHKNHTSSDGGGGSPIRNFVASSATSSQSSNSSRLPLYADGVNHSLTSEYELYAGNDGKQKQWQQNIIAATNRAEKLRHSFPYPLQNSLDNSSDYYSSILLLSSAGSGTYLPQQPNSPHPLPPYGFEHCQIACAPYLMQRSSSGIEATQRNIRPPSFTAPPPPPSLPPPIHNSRNLLSNIQESAKNFHQLRSSPTIL